VEQESCDYSILNIPRASLADKYAGAALFRVSAPAKQKCTRVVVSCARGNCMVKFLVDS
jgi:hypothetical protein